QIPPAQRKVPSQQKACRSRHPVADKALPHIKYIPVFAEFFRESSPCRQPLFAASFPLTRLFITGLSIPVFHFSSLLFRLLASFRRSADNIPSSATRSR